jgi:hypothetical protein
LDRLLLEQASKRGDHPAWAALAERHAHRAWAALQEEIRGAIEHVNSETPDAVSLTQIATEADDLELATSGAHTTKLRVGLRDQPWAIHVVIISRPSATFDEVGPWRWLITGTESHAHIVGPRGVTDPKNLVGEVLAPLVRLL